MANIYWSCTTLRKLLTLFRSLLSLWGRLPIPQRLRWTLVTPFVPKFAVGVVGVILNDQHEILLFHHTYRGKRYPWGLPSGWLDPREDPAEGIVREIKEETGLEARVVRPLFVDNALIIRRLDLIYLCERIGGEFFPSAEVDGMQYFCLQSLPEMLPNQREMIDKIFNALDKET
jgi:ADP-ribose pyrophosphatase YjhB (NUDIX family)